MGFDLNTLGRRRRMTPCHKRSHPLAVRPAPVANFLADRKDPSDGQAAKQLSAREHSEDSQIRRVEDLEEPVSTERSGPAPGQSWQTDFTKQMPYLPSRPPGLPLPARNGCAPPHTEIRRASLLFLFPLSWACCSSRSRRSSRSCRSSCMPLRVRSVICRYAICVTASGDYCLVKSLLAPSPGRRVRLSIAASPHAETLLAKLCTSLVRGIGL